MTATFGAAVRVIIMQQGEPAMLNSQPRSPLGQCISDDIMEREGVQYEHTSITFYHGYT